MGFFSLGSFVPHNADALQFLFCAFFRHCLLHTQTQAHYYKLLVLKEWQFEILGSDSCVAKD